MKEELMTKKRLVGFLFMLLVLLLLPGLLCAANRDKLEFTDSFPLLECTFSNTGGNDYFILNPERALYYTNQACIDEGECDELEELTITVTNDIEEVNFEVEGTPVTVETRVVMEEEYVDGELLEESWNYFAVCEGGNDVYYFGEEVNIYGEDGVTHDGEWLAGVDGALPGIVMPGGAFLLGARYYQEIAPGIALDRAENVAMGLSIEVSEGDYEDCVEIFEDTPLEKKSDSSKFYCPGVGLVIDDDLMLEEILNEGSD